jgi:hypothetical protein
VLIVVSLVLGLAVGMPMGNIVKAFETGVGNALGHIALVVGLGTMLGKMMAESGGAERIANTMIKAFGEKNVHWAMMTVAFIVGLPVFFESVSCCWCRSPSTSPSVPGPTWCWWAFPWWPACRWCTASSAAPGSPAGSDRL